MKQQTEQAISGSGQYARFRELVSWWADRLGRHQVPLREEHGDINDLLSHDAVHHDLIHEIVRRVYSQNRCGHLDALIELEDTFTALGHVREKLLKSTLSDVDQINLLDDIGWYTRQYFGRVPGGQPAAAANDPADPVSEHRATL